MSILPSDLDSKPDLISVDRYEWERILRRCVLPPTVKAVAAFAAQYANRDGTRVYPGVNRLAAVTGLSERSVRRALQTLRELGLLARTRKGSSLGRQALTDEHKLTRPVDLDRRLHLLDPEETPASAACDSTCGHTGSQARPAAASTAKLAEHRQLTTGTPATRAGTPATDDRNTGRSCTPPTHDQPQPNQDQRDESDRDVTTEGGDDLYARLVRIDELAARRRGA